MTAAIGFTIRGRLDLAVLVAPETRGLTLHQISELEQHKSVLGQIDASLKGAFDPQEKETTRGNERGDLSVLRSIDESIDKKFGVASELPPVKDLEESDGAVAAVVKIEVLSATIKRNPIGSADNFTFSVDWSGLPVDPRAYEGAQFSFWLYTHDDIHACRPGDAGNWGGIVDKVKRDRRNKTINFTCRDWTAIPLEEEISPADLASIDLDQTLFRVVENILDFMDNNTGWYVIPRGRLATAITPDFALAEERLKKTKATADLKFELAPEIGAAVKLLNAGVSPHRKVFDAVPVNFPEEIRNQTELNRPVVQNAIAARGLNSELTIKAAEILEDQGVEGLNQLNGAVIATVVNKKPAGTKKLLVKPKASTLFGRGRMKVWKAVVRVCALMGAAPEIAITTEGEIGVVIVDVADLAAGDTLRTFERTDADGIERQYRRLTEGETIGKVFTEERDLAGGRKIDYVSVNAPNPDTGRILGPIRHGRPRKQGQSKSKGFFLTVPGVTSEEHLARIARATYYDLVAGELRLKIGSPNPWTDGGGPDDPDLLYCGAGAMFEIRFAGFEEQIRDAPGRRKGLAQILQAQGLSEKAAEILAGAQDRARTVPLFQVLRHTMRFQGEGDGAFASVLELQTYVGAVDPPVSSADRRDNANTQNKFEDIPDATDS